MRTEEDSSLLMSSSLTSFFRSRSFKGLGRSFETYIKASISTHPSGFWAGCHSCGGRDVNTKCLALDWHGPGGWTNGPHQQRHAEGMCVWCVRTGVGSNDSLFTVKICTFCFFHCINITHFTMRIKNQERNNTATYLPVSVFYSVCDRRSRDDFSHQEIKAFYYCY